MIEDVPDDNVVVIVDPVDLVRNKKRDKKEENHDLGFTGEVPILESVLASCRAYDFLGRSAQIFSFILRSCHTGITRIFRQHQLIGFRHLNVYYKKFQIAKLSLQLPLAE